jgi:hypothetical protein
MCGSYTTTSIGDFFSGQFRNDFIIQQYALDLCKIQDQCHYELLCTFSILNFMRLGDFLVHPRSIKPCLRSLKV